MAKKKKSDGQENQPAAAGEAGANSGALTHEQREAAEREAWEKRLKAAYRKFKSVENRQAVVERLRRVVFEYMQEITHKNIELAKQGNCSSAKFLMQLAGIDEIPAVVEKVSRRKKGACAAADPTEAVFSFSRKLGMEPLKLKPPKPVEAELSEDAGHHASIQGTILAGSANGAAS